MEDIIKFGFYAVIGIIYIVSQLRKAKNKQAEEQRDADFVPTPVIERKPVRVSEVANTKRSIQQDSSNSSGYRNKRVFKPLLKAKIKELPKVQVEYKTLDSIQEDEDSELRRVLAERRVEEGLMHKDRIVQNEEHLKSFVELEGKKKKSEFAEWFQKKGALKQAFVASEIFNRKF